MPTQDTNWKFFLEFQGLFAGVFVVAFFPAVRPRELWQRLRNGTLRLETALFLVLLLALSGHVFMTVTGSAYRLLKANGTVRAVLAGLPDSAWLQGLMQIRTGHAEVVGTAAARLNVEQCLTDLGNRPLDQKRTTALYIPKTNRDYWDMRQVGPGSTPFIAPAFSGMTMVEGLPEFDDIGWAAIGWGYPQYRLPTRSEAPSDHSQEAIAKARAEGFHVLLILDTTSSHSCQIRKIELFPSVNGMPTSEVPTL